MRKTLCRPFVAAGAAGREGSEKGIQERNPRTCQKAFGLPRCVTGSVAGLSLFVPTTAHAQRV
jgi:hypothetical protein